MGGRGLETSRPSGDSAPADTLAQQVDDAVLGDDDALDEVAPAHEMRDVEDFASFYINAQYGLRLRASRMLSDQRDIDEVVQETFLRLFLAMPDLETQGQAIAFSRRVITNLCIDRYRADRRRPQLFELDTEAAACIEGGDCPDDPLLRAEDAAVVRRALGLLSPLHRAALIKREIEEKPLPVIAAELDVPEESVKHLLHRARRALRRLLTGSTVDPDVDLSFSEIADAANRRLAAATLRGANAILALVAVVLVVGVGVRAAQTPESPASASDSPTHAGAPAATVPAPTTARAPRAARSGKRRGSPSGGATSEQPVVRTPPVADVPSYLKPKPAPLTKTPGSPGGSRPVIGMSGGGRPAPSTSGGLAKGVFSLEAPVLGQVSNPGVAREAVMPGPTGGVENQSTFSATTASGDFSLQQDVQMSSQGVVSANLTPSVPLPTGEVATQTYSSSVSSAPGAQGDVVVNVELVVTPSSAAPVDSAPVLPAVTVNVQTLYAADLSHAEGETVTVTAAVPPLPSLTAPQPAPSATLPPTTATTLAPLDTAPETDIAVSSGQDLEYFSGQ